MSVAVRNLAVFDSTPLEVESSAGCGLLDLARAVLRSGAPGEAWLMHDDVWLHADDGALEVVERQCHDLGCADRDAPIDPSEFHGILDDLDCAFFLDSDRLRCALEELSERFADADGGFEMFDRDKWPSDPFWMRLVLTFYPHGRRNIARLMIRHSMWIAPPVALGPSALADAPSAPIPIATAKERLVELESFSFEVSWLGMFFDVVRLGVREVFGARWLPPASVVIEPELTESLSPAAYLSGELAPLTGQIAQAFLDKADFRDTTIAACELGRASLCLHRQFTMPGDTSQVFSKYCHLQLTSDRERFERHVDYVVGGFEAIESEVSSDLWDVSSELEMAESHLGVQREVATGAGELVDALVVRLLEGDGAIGVAAWRLAARRRLRRARLGLRETIELVRRTLLQTEGERETALSMIDLANEGIDRARAYVDDRVSRLITQVRVDGYPTVTESLLTSLYFRQAEQRSARVRQASDQGARLGHLLETTTNVFGEEQARELAGVERNGSLLNIVLGVVALFTLVEFLFEVRFDLGGMAVTIIRSIAALAGIAVLCLLAWVWRRNRGALLPVPRSAVPELQNEVISTMRLMRMQSGVGVTSSDGEFELALDDVLAHRVSALYDEVGEYRRAVERLRRAYVIRRVAEVPVDGADELLAAATEKVPRVLADYLRGKVDGRAWSAAGDLDLLRVEASLWSVETLLRGERPSRMYNSTLPRTTAILYLHPGQPMVSQFEVRTQLGADDFERVIEIRRLLDEQDDDVVSMSEVLELLLAPPDADGSAPEFGEPPDGDPSEVREDAASTAR